MSEALYFPFSRCLDELTLKRAALVYDQLLFVDPVTPEARNALYLREQHADPTITHRWRRAQQHYERLEYEGIAKTVTANVINDPEGIDALVADGLHVDIEINKTPGTLFNGRHRWKMLASRVPESMYYGRHQPKPAQAFAGEEIVEVSYAAGSSLSLTHAIAIAHELGATPLTDSKSHHDLLLYRMKTAAAAGADQQLPGMHAPPPGPPDAYLRRQIELRVIDALIPDERLHGMDFGELIDYRHSTRRLARTCPAGSTSSPPRPTRSRGTARWRLSSAGSPRRSGTSLASRAGGGARRTRPEGRWASGSSLSRAR